MYILIILIHPCLFYSIHRPALLRNLQAILRQTKHLQQHASSSLYEISCTQIFSCMPKIPLYPNYMSCKKNLHLPPVLSSHNSLPTSPTLYQFPPSSTNTKSCHLQRSKSSALFLPKSPSISTCATWSKRQLIAWKKSNMDPSTWVHGAFAKPKTCTCLMILSVARYGRSFPANPVFKKNVIPQSTQVRDN